jgi:HEAT repeat protein
MRGRVLTALIGVSLSGLPLWAARSSEIEAAREVLRAGFDSKDSAVRMQAIVAAGMVGRSQLALRRVEAALEDKDVTVRIAAAGTLADLKSYQSRPLLRKALSDNVPEVAFAAAKSLYAMHDAAGKRALIEILDKEKAPESNPVRREARNVFEKFHSPGSAAMFIVRQGLGYVPLPGVGEGFSALMEIVNDPNLSPRASVVLLLGKEKDSEARRILENGLKDKDWSVRACAAQIIAQTARMDLVELLPPLFDDKDDKVRFRAAGAYLHLSAGTQR